ncbi:ternary complex factor MIP1 leucine-zipper protein [Arabidopsis thaliana]|uniref:Ternary complex factor MIP1 leucine-zipper protein n=1 Tax=Arabidopsis thaliana TaxID=3702 RepID=F4J9X5_ARATH|nr:ternary complex factor MIP1 leucine-zipper protein [Arabidopsis thaliana]AEE76165.2 ternary complex factor MIP1 leucine-zipper protein [Arabidopsis thaliana]|eukprot:NP_001319586.1 ternary complex factor MIP1 leucine-zipper protein [Arabidopsis thaliana]
MTTRTSNHKRSRSDPVPRKSLKNKKSSEALYNIHMDELLQREIEQLKSLLKSRKLHPGGRRVSSDEIDLLLQEDEVLVRREMKTVLGRKLFLEDSKNEDSSIPKEAKKLVEEIAGLELQVMYLETYLLLLYRRFFNNKITSKLESEEKERSEDLLECTKLIDSPKKGVCSPQKLVEDSGIFRSHSSLSHCSGYSFRMSPHAMDSSYHRSLPFSMLEQSDIDELIGTYVSENVHKSPNSLSEEMVKCISELCRQLVDPGSLDNDLESSSPFRGKEPLKIISRPYDKLLMVKSISRDSEKLNAVEPALKHFRSLVNKLEGVNPRKLNHEEKLAFWINIHNSLVMHSILVYGNPKNSMKRVSGLLKAAYNVGGRSLNLDTIQTSILGCRVSRPGLVFRFLFASRSKGRAGDLGRDYAITHRESLLHFALCSGSLSDPSVSKSPDSTSFLILHAIHIEGLGYKATRFF